MGQPLNCDSTERKAETEEITKYTWQRELSPAPETLMEEESGEETQPQESCEQNFADTDNNKISPLTGQVKLEKKPAGSSARAGKKPERLDNNIMVTKVEQTLGVAETLPNVNEIEAANNNQNTLPITL